VRLLSSLHGCFANRSHTCAPAHHKKLPIRAGSRRSLAWRAYSIALITLMSSSAGDQQAFSSEACPSPARRPAAAPRRRSRSLR